MRTRADLRKAQVWGVETLKRPWAIDPKDRLPGIILAWDMGAGKSGTVLTALRDLFDQCVIRRALVVAPKLVVQTTWPDEIESWEHTRALTWTLLRVEEDDFDTKAAGDIAYRRAKLQGKDGKERMKDRQEAVAAAKLAKLGQLAAQDTEIHLINKEGLPWLWDHFGQGKRWPYDVIVLDDVREAKSGKKRSRGSIQDGRKAKGPLSRFGILAQARKHVDAVIELTGTPTPNGLANLWGQAYLVDLGERLGTSRTAFEQRWFNFNKYSYEVTPHAHSEGEIMGRLKDIMFSLGPEDYPDLPPTVNNLIRVKLPDPILAEYRKFERILVSEKYDVEAVNSGVLHNKLLQFANGSMYREDGEDVLIHDVKLEALERIVAETQGESLLVAYSYRFDLDRIRKKFPNSVVLNETNPRDFMRRWNAGEISMGLAHPASAGHGLNFQFGGHHAVWYGLTSDLELYLQFNKRLSRPGQTKPVFLHHILAVGTIDEDIMPLYLDPKTQTQDRVLASVRVAITGRSQTEC